MVIYRVTNIINGKMYIGKTTLGLQKRKERHFKSVKSGSVLHFHRALRKYGFDKFVWEKICNCNSKKDLSKKEIEFIKKYDTYDGDGYNMTPGGDGVGCKHSEETKRKISLSKMGDKNPMYGVGHTEETKQQMSIDRRGVGNSFYGNAHSKDSKRKMRNSHLGVPRSPHSDKTKSKMSLKSKGTNNSQNKLSESEVKDIRELLVAGNLYSREIAVLFGVSKSTIDKIKHNRTWKWLK